MTRTQVFLVVVLPLAVFVLAPLIRRRYRNRFLWEVCERLPDGRVVPFSFAPMPYAAACDFLQRYHQGGPEDKNFFLRRVERKP